MIKTIKIPEVKCPNKKCTATVSGSKVYKTLLDRVKNCKRQYRTCGTCCENYITETSLY